MSGLSIIIYIIVISSPLPKAVQMSFSHPSFGLRPSACGESRDLRLSFFRDRKVKAVGKVKGKMEDEDSP